jgi:hypothetical protein
MGKSLRELHNDKTLTYCVYHDSVCQIDLFFFKNPYRNLDVFIY